MYTDRPRVPTERASVSLNRRGSTASAKIGTAVGAEADHGPPAHRLGAPLGFAERSPGGCRGWLRPDCAGEFLTDEQAEAYGKFAEESTRPELERFFFLDDVDRDLIALRHSTHHQLGFALQMCTVRYICRFLPDDPLDAPWPVVEHLAAQLGIEDPSPAHVVPPAFNA